MYLLILMLAVTAMVHAENSYVVTFPAKIRPNMKLAVNVHILKSTGNVAVKVSVLRGDNVVVNGQGTFKAGVPSTVTLKIPANLVSAEYTLKVVGSGGLAFTNSTTFTYSSKDVSLFIQTDKPIYKPGDIVNLRAFGMYPDTKIYTGALDISISDAASNKIKEWTKLTSTTGVITQMLTLSAFPVLGDWNIQVKTETSNAERVFTVAEYVLPKFEVDVLMPPYVLTSETDIKVTIKVKYTYDKPVDGTAVVTLLFTYDFSYNNAQKVSVVTAQVVNGEAVVSFSLSEVKKISNYLNGYTLIASATVTESLTGNNMTGNGTVKIYDSSTVLEFLKTNPNVFKPGLRYTAYLKVSQPNGQPPKVTNNKVTIKSSYDVELPGIKPTPYPFYQNPTENKQLPDKQLNVPSDGLIDFFVDFPQNAKSATIQAQLQGVNAYLYLGKSRSPSNHYIQLTLESTSIIQAGVDIPLKVKATEPIRNLIYLVLSRGLLIKTGTININNKSTHSFTIKSDSSFAPDCRIVVYYIRADGELVTDSISMDINGIFQNKVSISFNTTEVEPGNKVKFTVKADPRSSVYTMCIDQSLLLLKESNDITTEDVHSELKTYDSVDENNPFGCINCMRKKRFIWWPRINDGSDASEILRKSGLKFLTDVLVYHYEEPHPPIYFLAFSNTMGSVGDSSLTQNSNLMKPTRVRTDFSETFLWNTITIGNNGTGSVDVFPPDTITSFVASAFATNSLTGLGIAPTQAKLRVFRPFFVSLNLPYSVIRGELLALQAIVFNYMQEDMQVRVTLAKSDSFSNIVIFQKGKEEIRQEETIRTVFVKAGTAVSVYFPVILNVLGKINIEIKAQSTRAADAIRMQLLVEPEGVPREYNIPMFIDLTDGKKTFNQTADLTLPDNVVKDSERIKISLVGDLMGPSLNGLEKLIQLPCGCGEQNMLYLAPVVFVANYLKSVNKFTGPIKIKALNFMEIGYQQELTYKHQDGSYSAFGESDGSGSSWLTAFVVKVFCQAHSHIYIDENVLRLSLGWLIGLQQSDGSFPEPGNVIHKEMQSNSANGESLTAFILISLLECEDVLVSVGGGAAINKALKFLEAKVADSDDIYFLALVSYAFQLAGSNKTKVVLDKLNGKATVKDGLKYWHKEETSTDTSYWRGPNPTKAVNTEMTSYIALTYILRGEIAIARDLVKWIVKQMNPNGGFQSTQDTVVALLALSKFSELIYNNNFNIRVTVTLGDTLSYNFIVDQSNALIYQIQEIPSVPSKVRVNATGSGVALLEVSVRFNVQRQLERPTFELTLTLLDEDINFLVLQICARWNGTGTGSGMAIQKIGFPSGFEPDLDSIQLSVIKRKEMEGNKLILYFYKIETTFICVKIRMTRVGLVAKSQPVPVQVYDYYAPENQVTAFYESEVLKNSKIDDICKDCVFRA